MKSALNATVTNIMLLYCHTEQRIFICHTQHDSFLQYHIKQTHVLDGLLKRLTIYNSKSVMQPDGC